MVIFPVQHERILPDKHQVMEVIKDIYLAEIRNSALTDNDRLNPSYWVDQVIPNE